MRNICLVPMVKMNLYLVGSNGHFLVSKKVINSSRWTMKGSNHLSIFLIFNFFFILSLNGSKTLGNYLFLYFYFFIGGCKTWLPSNSVFACSPICPIFPLQQTQINGGNYWKYSPK